MVGQDQWARRGENDARIAANTIPVGVINAYWGTTAPSGWLLCDGAAIPTQYAALIALVGANTPNLKGKVIVGVDAAQTEFAALAAAGGAKTQTIASANLPVHTHGLNGHNHGGATTSAGGSSHDHGLTGHNHGGGTGIHSHSFPGGVGGTSNTAHTHYIGGSAGAVGTLPQGAGSAASTADLSTVGVANTTEGSADTGHTHSTTVNGDSGSTTNGAFANTAVTTLPPYVSVNYIIRAA